MNKKSFSLGINLLFVSCFVYTMQLDTRLEPVHVVYSHAYFEESKREFKGELKEEKPFDYNPVLTFYEKKTFKSRSGRSIPMGDDSTLFTNSYAMQFAHLGQSLSVPSYPDEPKQLGRAVLYTQPAVTALAEHLHQRVLEGKKRIVVVGPCVGAGIALNCFKKLAKFNENVDYFSSTSIKSKDEAQAILDAVNNGGFVGIVPLLSVKKHNAIAFPSALLSGLTVTAATIAAYCYGADAIAHDPEVAKLSLMSVGLLGYCVAGESIKNVYSAVIKHVILPLISSFHYNSLHEDPIDFIEGLKEVLTGPMAVNFTGYDWVMEWADDDIIRLYDFFKKENMHMLITNDKGHMEISSKFLEFLVEYKKKHIDGDKVVDLSKYKSQPTVQELKKRIYPYGIFSRIWASNKWAISLVVLLSMLPLYRMLSQQASLA